ncbi:polysaccharide deacetylase family protein [Frigoribacterium sp. CG_9.8]|uniref:polysaccharide deacetylase family protein n=1 Tax=Frigoribacterium sp. CG_9.8 TaxID=2787733 RepID=UPI0018CBAAFE|nr:polysaccharide deacetylase family protein [Frigoribacterium sp. CG_9.8]MBG6108415.1 peptidoglycan/xylan/chitin deacetylase (PgdA/CDA1 family) [Frigoribacterium sp. CG_9.8]
MDRRLFFAALVGGAALVLTGCAQRLRWNFPTVTTAATLPPSSPPVTPTSTPLTPEPSSSTLPSPTPSPAPLPIPTVDPVPLPGSPQLVKVALPAGVISKLPGRGALLAWTVDDGINAEVIPRYIEFAAATGTRITFFLNGTHSGWTTYAALLRPLVASGQVQLGNHTWDHANLTKLGDGQVVMELQRNHDFISNTYGVDARPYYRPPYGFHNARVDRLAASIGYTTPVMWFGSLSDSALRVPGKVVTFADQWFLPGHIVIGHANFLPVTTVFPQLSEIIHGRGLQTVTLNDVFIRP